MTADRITIPPEVVEAAAKARWGCAKPTEWEKETCRLIITAALAAWPGKHVHETRRSWLGGFSERELMLPLPQENSNDR